MSNSLLDLEERFVGKLFIKYEGIKKVYAYGPLSIFVIALPNRIGYG